MSRQWIIGGLQASALAALCRLLLAPGAWPVPPPKRWRIPVAGDEVRDAAQRQSGAASVAPVSRSACPLFT